MILLNKTVKIYTNSERAECRDELRKFTYGKIINIIKVEPYRKGKYLIKQRYKINPIDYVPNKIDIVKYLELFMCDFTSDYNEYEIKKN